VRLKRRTDKLKALNIKTRYAVYYDVKSRRALATKVEVEKQ